MKILYLILLSWLDRNLQKKTEMIDEMIILVCVNFLQLTAFVWCKIKHDCYPAMKHNFIPST